MTSTGNLFALHLCRMTHTPFLLGYGMESLPNLAQEQHQSLLEFFEMDYLDIFRVGKVFGVRLIIGNGRRQAFYAQHLKKTKGKKVL